MFGSKVRSKFAVAVLAPVVMAMIAVTGTPQLAFGASALPVVLSFTATKTTIADTGGSTVLKARLRYATSCRISVSRSLKGMPRSFSCASDIVSQSVTLPANKSENPITYTFGMVVKNKAGDTTATNVVVTEGSAPPPISFTPTTLVFGKEGVFVQTNPYIVTVTNNSSTTQLITSVAVGNVGDPNDFVINKNNCSYITAHANCSLAVQFQPGGAGLRTGAVNVLDASWGTAGATAVLKVEGTGVWATATIENANISKNVLNFLPQGVLSASPYQYLTVSDVAHAGAVPLYISGIGVTGSEAADFDSPAAPITDGNCINENTNGFPLIVSVGQSCTFGVAFDPSGSGTRTTNIVVYDNTLGTQNQLELQGSGVYSTDTLSINGSTPEASPVSYDFSPSTAVGVAEDATLTIQNTSSVILDFTGVGSTGINKNEFAVNATPTCAGAGVELAVGQSCQVQLVFDPQASGPRSATLLINDNSPDGGERINVTGTGS